MTPNQTTPASTQFDYLLNAFEQASQSDKPAENDYAEKRKALFDYVRKLEGNTPASGLTDEEIEAIWCRIKDAAKVYFDALDKEASARMTFENAEANFSDKRPETANLTRCIVNAGMAKQALLEAIYAAPQPSPIPCKEVVAWTDDKMSDVILDCTKRIRSVTYKDFNIALCRCGALAEQGDCKSHPASKEQDDYSDDPEAQYARQLRLDVIEECAVIAEEAKYKIPYPWPNSLVIGYEMHTPKHACLAIAAAIRQLKEPTNGK